MTPLPRLYSRRTLFWMLIEAGVRNPDAILDLLQQFTYRGCTLYVWPEVAE